jgi:multidrug resistance efflux pump
MNRMFRLILFAGLLWYAACAGSNDSAVKAPGIVDGDIITIKSLTTGRISAWNIDSGMAVQKGDILAETDSRKVENSLEELDINERDIRLKVGQLQKKAQLVTANIDYLSRQVERFKRLKRKAAVSGDKLEQAELRLLEARTSLFDIRSQLSALEVQQAKIKNKRAYLELVLEDHRIAAPVSGIVLETFVSAGETVLPGANIADILKTASLYVEVFLEEAEIGALQLNQPASILIDGLEGQTFEGHIAYFGRKAEFSPKYIISEKERKGLLYQVKVKIAAQDGDRFKVGMPVTVVFKK